MFIYNTFFTTLIRNIIKPHTVNYNQKAYITKLVEIGHLDTPRTSTNYESGQLFINKVFGYRGIVLFPWLTKVYDSEINENNHKMAFGGWNSSKYNMVNYYYQVLMDSRDQGSIKNHIGTTTSRGYIRSTYRLHSFPGLDYVAHEDILPYTATEQLPITNELYDHFFHHQPNKHPHFQAKNTLKAWQAKSIPWLSLTDVYKEITDNIRVTVIPFYVGSRKTKKNNVYWWKYCVRVENLGDLAVQIKYRHWRIFGFPGSMQTVRGQGILGQEPLLNKVFPAFQYSSHVSLHNPCGYMWGTFTMIREDGTLFECQIPLFMLRSKKKHENTKVMKTT